MTAPGVEVRPLRQITGEAEFNEVFLTDVRIPDADRIGAVGQGWQVSTATLMNERVSIGGGALPREGGMIGSAAQAWREHPALRTPGLHERLLRLWAEAEVARLAGIRLRQQLAAGQPGPEGSAAKLVFARLNQDITEFEVELAGADGLRYDDWTMRRPAVDQLLRPRRRIPVPAVQGQLDRGRDLGDPAQHRGRAGARAAARDPGGQGRPMEGPAAMSQATEAADSRAAGDGVSPGAPAVAPDLLYTEQETDLRGAVRALLEDRAGWRDVLARTETADTYRHRAVADPGRRRWAARACWCPRTQGGAGASYREAAVVAEELGRHVAPVPFLGSAVIATTALLSAGDDELLGQVASGEVTAALAVPFAAGAAGPRRACCPRRPSG